MADQMTNYQCPACSGGLRFDEATGKLVCDYCGSLYSPGEIEALYEGKDQQAQAAFEEQVPAEDEPEVQAEMAGGHWDQSTISESWGEATGQMRSYSCPSCGGEVICEMTTAATQCPYCGNPNIIPGQFKDTLKPDYVIPFAQDKEAAVAALKSHYRKKLFLPKAFTRDNEIKKLQGVYVPFWLFDADAAADLRFKTTRSHTYRRGDYQITETSHYHVVRQGRVRFDRVPADASRKMPDDLMDSIEPYDHSGLKPFSTAYLPGFLADRFDVSIEESAQRADERCYNTVEDLFRQDVKGYATVTPAGGNIDLGRGKVHYALLPVWILKTKWHDRDYLFAMNGQTGKLVGDLPVSKGRFFLFWLILTVVLSAALCFLLHRFLA